MKTIRIKIYKFKELTKEAQQKAISELEDINVNGHWWKPLYEDAESIGLKIEGFDLYRGEMEGKFIWDEIEAANEILETHGAGTETHQTAEKFLEDFTPIYNTWFERDEPDATNQDLANDGDLEAEMYVIKEKFLKSLLRDYKNLLQSDYNYLTSDETIIETIEANEYDFTKDGKLFLKL